MNLLFLYVKTVQYWQFHMIPPNIYEVIYNILQIFCNGLWRVYFPCFIWGLHKVISFLHSFGALET
jgi:hypothetical protein